MEAWIIWLIVAATFLIVEVLTQTLWSLCLAIGTLLALAVSLLGASPVWQLVGLSVGTGLAYLMLKPWLMRMRLGTNGPQAHDTRTGMDALPGRRAIVVDEIRPGHTGRVRIDGDNWQVIAPGVDTTVPRGREVVVTGYESIILQVALL